MKKKVMGSTLVALIFSVITIAAGDVYTSGSVFDDYYQFVTDNPEVNNQADPNDWKIDNANGFLAGVDSLTSDMLLKQYNDGTINIHHLAQAYAYDPIKFAAIKEYAEQSEYLNYYLEVIPETKDNVVTEYENTSSTAEPNNTNKIEGNESASSTDCEMLVEQYDNSAENATESGGHENNEKWDMTDLYELTCTKKGVTTYMSSLTGELDKILELFKAVIYKK